MKSNLKVMTMAAGVIMLAQAAVAQVNLNLNSTTSAVTKTTASTGRVTNAVTKTTQVTGRVVQNTGKIVQGTTNIASKTTANVQANINAAANANAKGRNLLIENESAINSNIAAETKGNSELVKETVVSEAKEIKEMPKEMRKDAKPGLNLKSETSANAKSKNQLIESESAINSTIAAETKGKSELVKETVVSEAKEMKDMPKEMRKDAKPGLNLKSETSAGVNAGVGNDGIAVSSEAKSSTKADAKTGVNADKAKEKVTDAKDKAEQKTSLTEQIQS
jgi:hypothetical protein